MMKKTRAFLIVVCIASMAVPTVTLGQDGGAAPKTLASTMNVYVFPKAGQVATVQSQDEAACYSWAVENTGTDPFELAKKAQEQQAQSEQQMAQAKNAGAGAGAAGAVKGAAVGALIGEIADDDPGSGAAYGAAAGMIRGKRGPVVLWHSPHHGAIGLQSQAIWPSPPAKKARHR